MGNPGLFTQIGQIVTQVVGAAGGLALAWTLVEFYHAAILFMKGGYNAQKREEAKTHLVHVAFGAAMVGGAGVVLAGLLHIL